MHIYMYIYVLIHGFVFVQKYISVHKWDQKVFQIHLSSHKTEYFCSQKMKWKHPLLVFEMQIFRNNKWNLKWNVVIKH